MEWMESFVDHVGDVTAAGCTPGNSLVDVGEFTNLLQGLVDFLVDPLDASVEFCLGRIAALDRWKYIIHIGLVTVALNNLDCFVCQDHPCLLVELCSVVDNHISFNTIACQQADVDGRHSAGVITEQK